jgi:hypothetical protein
MKTYKRKMYTYTVADKEVYVSFMYDITYACRRSIARENITANLVIYARGIIPIIQSKNALEKSHHTLYICPSKNIAAP